MTNPPYTRFDNSSSVVSGLGSIDSDGVYSTGDIGYQTSNVAATVRATVTAIGDGTNADVGHSATATDDEAFVVAPYPAPTLVAASGDGRVDLSWAIPSAWSAFSLRWDVQRKLSSASSWTQVAQVTSPSYRASGLNNGTSYDFRVRAIDPAGAPVTPDSPWSGTVSATPEALAYPYPDAQSGGPYVGTITSAGGTASVRVTGTVTGGTPPFNQVGWGAFGSLSGGYSHTYVFSRTGVFNRTFRVEDADGRRSSRGASVTIDQQLGAIPMPDPHVVYIGTERSFDFVETGDILVDVVGLADTDNKDAATVRLGGPGEHPDDRLVYVSGVAKGDCWVRTINYQGATLFHLPIRVEGQP